MTHRGLWLSALVTVPAVAVLLGLGTWQVQRLQWKTQLVETRAAAFVQPAVPLPADDSAAAALAWMHISVSGTFRHGQEFHLWSLRDGDPGYQVLTPLSPAGAGAAVLVDRGWVPEDHKDAASRTVGQVGYEVAIEGYVRPGLDARTWLTPANETAANIWYSVDFAEMEARDGEAYRRVVVVEDAASNPGGLPFGAAGLPDLVNNHRQYAFTWFSLAAALVVIWGLAARRARDGGRRPGRAPGGGD